MVKRDRSDESYQRPIKKYATPILSDPSPTTLKSCSVFSIKHLAWGVTKSLRDRPLGGLQSVYPVDKSDVYFELTSLTIGFLMNGARYNLPTALHPDPYQMYSVCGIFCLFLYGEIHIFAPAFFEFQCLEI